MRALVTAASRHGSTTEIAAVLAETFRGNGVDVDLVAPGEVHELTGYDTIVLGSAVYYGRWMKEAKDFADRFSDALRLRQVWLFSSGPIGSDESSGGDPSDVASLVDTTGAAEHRSFSGKLDRTVLGFGEKLASRAVHAPEGDFRNWASVRSWAESIIDTPRRTRHLEPEGNS